MRRLEVRIGQLLGPAKPGPQPESSVATEDRDLSRHERHEFRQMAANPEAVEDIIATSTDDEPPSRRKVMAAIKPHQSSPGARRHTSEEVMVKLEASIAGTADAVLMILEGVHRAPEPSSQLQPAPSAADGYPDGYPGRKRGPRRLSGKGL
jgi:hypothetical protein